jgi:hypothetical protein
MFTVVFLGLALGLAALNLAFDKYNRTTRRVAELFLFYLIFICVGAGGLMGFFGHAFRADTVARDIGWPTGSPFQFEIAIANLAFGILGILCAKFRGYFWLATGIGSSIFYLGAAFGHIRDMIVNHNHSPYNAGLILYIGDILVPLLMIILMILYFRKGKR